VIFGALNLTESGSPIIDLEFAKSSQEKFTAHSLGSPMIMEGLMEECSISRDVCFLKGSPIADHQGKTGLPNSVQVSLGKRNSHTSMWGGRSSSKGSPISVVEAQFLAVPCKHR
jgi:hypothetical protein